MGLKIFQSFFEFSRGQRLGVMGLFLIIVIIQFSFIFLDFSTSEINNPQKQDWLALQPLLDNSKSKKTNYTYKIYPFNPNFITDFKGYKLGMSTAEIDRLLAFRKLNKFANSPKEFQNVTQISDSLLNAISPYFKFPDWVNNKNSYKSNYQKNEYQKNVPLKIIDINLATKEDLMRVYGIGDAISDRILKQKETYGGFVSMEQMIDIWGLSPEVIQKLNESFKIISKPIIKKIDINNASAKELSSFSYFRYPLSKEIVIYRTMNGDIKNIEDLTKIKGFPVDKIKIIALYLQF